MFLSYLTPTLGQCKIDSGMTPTILMTDRFVNRSSSESMIIKCGAQEDSIIPVTRQPTDWKIYFDNIAKAYSVPLNDLKASIIIRLTSSGETKRWVFNMNQSKIIGDSQPYPLHANQEYKLTIEGIYSGYAMNSMPQEEININLPTEAMLLSTQQTLPITSVLTKFEPSVQACVPRAFIVTPSRSEIDFGRISITGLNQGKIHTEYFTIDVRRADNNLCAIKIIKPEISFSHYARENDQGDIILPERRLLFRILNESNEQIKFNQYQPMKELNVMSPSINRYKAQIFRDPTVQKINPGRFQATIVYSVRYR